MAESVVRLKRELKYEGAILKIYEDTVMANGHEAHWDFIHHDGAAAVLPVADDGKILMVRQYRNALDRQTLEIPAGKLDEPDEPKIECAYRELEEEPPCRYGLLVNATSVGMYPHWEACPVSERVVARCSAVFDAVYNPTETALLKKARGLGAKTVPGMGMLVCQAAYSHKIWYDTEFKNEDILQLIADAQRELAVRFGGGV